MLVFDLRFLDMVKGVVSVPLAVLTLYLGDGDLSNPALGLVVNICVRHRANPARGQEGRCEKMQPIRYPSELESFKATASPRFRFRAGPGKSLGL